MNWEGGLVEVHSAAMVAYSRCCHFSSSKTDAYAETGAVQIDDLGCADHTLDRTRAILRGFQRKVTLCWFGLVDDLPDRVAALVEREGSSRGGPVSDDFNSLELGSEGSSMLGFPLSCRESSESGRHRFSKAG